MVKIVLTENWIEKGSSSYRAIIYTILSKEAVYRTSPIWLPLSPTDLYLYQTLRLWTVLLLMFELVWVCLFDNKTAKIYLENSLLLFNDLGYDLAVMLVLLQ